MNRYDTFSEILTSEDGVSYESSLCFMDYLYTGKIVYHKVQESEVNRLDLIAWKYFFDPSQWYPIALYNGLRDPLTLPLGTELAIPVDALTASDYEPFTYE